MKKLAGFSAGMCLVFTGLVTGLGFAAAQEMPPRPPKVLVIQREMLKPGRAGNTHLKTESAFVQAMTAASESRGEIPGRPRGIPEPSNIA